MRGAIVFIVAFLLFFIVTLAYQDLPPGQAIYDAVIVEETDYEVLGISATQLIVAIFNGIIYGIIIWLIFWLAEKAGIIPGGKKETTVTVKS